MTHYLDDRFSQFLARMAANRPGDISISPRADQFEARKEHLAEITRLFDEYVHTLAIETSSHSHEIVSGDFDSVFVNAAHDASLLSQFDDAAEAVRLSDAEFAADRKGWAKAHAMGVD